MGDPNWDRFSISGSYYNILLNDSIAVIVTVLLHVSILLLNQPHWLVTLIHISLLALGRVAEVGPSTTPFNFYILSEKYGTDLHNGEETQMGLFIFTNVASSCRRSVRGAETNFFSCVFEDAISTGC